MTKKIEIKKIKNTISYDAFISSINGLVGKVKNINLEVYFTSKKIYELEDIMFVLLNMYDNSGDMKALLVGNRNKDFISLVDNIKYGLKYRINGNISVLKLNRLQFNKTPLTNFLTSLLLLPVTYISSTLSSVIRVTRYVLFLFLRNTFYLLKIIFNNPV